MSLSKTETTAINLLLSKTEAHILEIETPSGCAIFKSCKKNLRQAIDASGFVYEITRDNVGNYTGYYQYWLPDFSLFLSIHGANDGRFCVIRGEDHNFELITPQHFCATTSP